MPTIKVRVSGKIAENLTPEVKIVCGNEDYQVEFEFDEPWESANVKTGLFIYNGELVAQPFDGAVCPMPIIENTTLLAIGVKTSDGRLFTTTPAYADCLKSASDFATNKIPAPSKDVYDEIIALLNKYISGVGSVDLSDYQKKVDDNLPTTNKTIVGAIAEVKEIAETARMVFGETEGTAYEGNKGKANADNIAKLQNELSIVHDTLEQSGLLKKYKQPIEQEYNERVTANGLNVLDGSKAVLKKVVGNTVRCENLTPYPYVEKSTTKNGITFTVNTDGSITVNGTATAFASFILANSNTLNLIAGKTYFISGGGKIIFAYYTETGATVIKNGLDNGKIEWKEGDNYPKFYIQVGSGVTVNETIYPMLNHGSTALPYQPYFTGLKSASFGGIESKNADGTETSTLIFPKTETPLGVTIDFENKKITDYGVEFVFKGTETVGVSGYLSGWNTIYFVGCLPTKEAKSQGICTDCNVVFGTGSWIAENTILIGNNNKDIHWCGILEKLGYATKGTELSAEEMTEAIANFKAYLAQRYADGNPVTIRYVSATLQSESDFTADNEYTAYKGGTEKVLGNDSAEFGAENTLTQDYIFVTEVK